MSFNKLLEEQLKKYLPDAALLEQPAFKRFLEAVNESYESYERDRMLSGDAVSITASEQRMRLALQTIEDNVWEYDFEQRKMVFAQVNNSVLKLRRLEYVDKENEEWWREIYEEDLHIAVDTFRKYKQGLISKHSVEYRMHCADGSIKWILNRGGVIKRDSEGQVLKVVGAITDIDALKNIQAELRTTANRLSNLLASLQSGVLVEDEARRIVMANQQFCSLLSIPAPPEALIGLDCSQTVDQSKHLFKNPELFLNRVAEILEDRQPVTGEELEMADGRILERSYIPVFLDNEHKGHLWKYNDITKRKQSETIIRLQEEKYRNIIANMNLGLTEVDLEERILYANQSFCEMSGYSLDELMNKVAPTLFMGKGNEHFTREKLQLRAQGISDAYELAVRNKKGQLKWWLVSGAPRYNDANELVGSIGIHLDITSHKQLELALMEARQAAEESAHAKETFLANMSHEIRTPISAILGMSRQLGETSLDQEQSLFLDNINKASEHLLVIINDILDISKIEAGMLQLENIDFRPAELVEQAITLMTLRAQEKGLLLSMKMEAGPWPVIMGDPFRLKQVLLNLLSNSIKFTEKGGVHITFNTMSWRGNQLTAVITVADTGIGMDEATLKNIFQNFTQGDKTTARKYGGTGLGMAISKQLVEMMGGTIQLQSKPGAGTSVVLRIPFDIGKEKNIPVKEKQIIDSSILKDCRVLLAEDNEINRLIACRILEKHGLVVTAVNNGQEALNAMAKQPFDVVLMDMQMPVMDGLEATAFIRANISRDIPVIALTANAIKGENEKCIQAGMNDYISKPFEPSTLISTIAHLVGKQLK
ncbi:PAS domain S-box-containing protein [Chitinophaga rupis]|uniref:histidine kinase n=1 Tax=Chitinophaga rupis TaxID=573321 RepID=A0A1H7ZMY5_9BACT|nr:PAS domain S-box protein [Chitinophaga rupis]SEM59643.1 PAS domain S-box-containing protein [Chitinophaga rupis]